jgi:hypothetical protein
MWVLPLVIHVVGGKRRPIRCRAGPEVTVHARLEIRAAGLYSARLSVQSQVGQRAYSWHSPNSFRAS